MLEAVGMWMMGYRQLRPTLESRLTRPLPAVRTASAAETSALASALARAFSEDPVTTWLLSVAAHRHRSRCQLAVVRLPLEGLDPAGPHHYVAVLEVDPSLESVIASCEVYEIPTGVEASHERSADFHILPGSRVRVYVDVPGGPRVWLTWCEP